jgi:hypothetical protein
LILSSKPQVLVNPSTATPEGDTCTIGYPARRPQTGRTEGPTMADRPTITARQLFRPLSVPDPWAGRALVDQAYRHLRPRACLRMLLAYYREPLAWFGALMTLAIVAYAGGAVMFVLHAEILGEQGPAISPLEHYALDSTLGFVGLAPLVAVVVPLTAWLVTAGPGTVRTTPYAVVGGLLFGLATGPAPIAHDLLVGRGTWLADRVTTLLSPNAPHLVAHVHGDGVSQTLSIGAQIAVGVPTYGLLLLAAVAVSRELTRRRWALAPLT